MTSLLQGSRQGSPLDSKRVQSFALPRLALGNYPWLYGYGALLWPCTCIHRDHDQSRHYPIVCRLRSLHRLSLSKYTEEHIMPTLRDDYFDAYRSLKLMRDAEGVLVAQLHTDGGPLTFKAQD